MKKILFVVLSSKEPFTKKAEEVIRSTWGKTVKEVPGCDIVYVRETDKVTYFEDSTLYVTSKVGFNYIYYKMYHAFLWLYLNKKFDYIVRINTSTWCNVKELVKFIRTQTTQDIYYGGLGISVRVVNSEMPYLNGNALVMPKSCIKTILEDSYCDRNDTVIDDIAFAYLWNRRHKEDYLDHLVTLGNYFYKDTLEDEVFKKYFFIQVKDFTSKDRTGENQKLVECDLRYRYNPVEVSPEIDRHWFSGDLWCIKNNCDLECKDGFHTDTTCYVSKETLKERLSTKDTQPSYKVISLTN